MSNASIVLAQTVQRVVGGYEQKTKKKDRLRALGISNLQERAKLVHERMRSSATKCSSEAQDVCSKVKLL